MAINSMPDALGVNYHFVFDRIQINCPELLVIYQQQQNVSLRTCPDFDQLANQSGEYSPRSVDQMPQGTN